VDCRTTVSIYDGGALSLMVLILSFVIEIKAVGNWMGEVNEMLITFVYESSRLWLLCGWWRLRPYMYCS